MKRPLKNFLPTPAEAKAYLRAGKRGKRPLTPYEKRVYTFIAKGGELKRARNKNPIEGEGEVVEESDTIVYDQIGGIWARKGQPHACDPECKESDHWYEHEFTEKFPIIGNPTCPNCGHCNEGTLAI